MRGWTHDSARAGPELTGGEPEIDMERIMHELYDKLLTLNMSTAVSG